MLKEFSIQSNSKEELTDITSQVQEKIQELKLDDGCCMVFTPHTTAAVTINENADPDVTRDMIYGLKKIVPESGYHHAEGNSSAHIKSSLFGCSQTVLVENGRLILGTWQGIYFCEFDGPRTRKVLVKVI